MSSFSLEKIGYNTGIINTEGTGAKNTDAAGFAKLLLSKLDASNSADTSADPLKTIMASQPDEAAVTSALSGLVKQEGGLKGALVLLCMMLSTGTAAGSGVGAMVSSLVAALSRVPRNEYESLRYNMLISDEFERGVLSRVNDMLFADSAQEAIAPYSTDRDSKPRITSNESNRSPGLYNAVINQFNVERNPRYAVNQKGTGDTYCNVFVLDVVKAMGAELPRTNANGIYNYLTTKGQESGWVRVTPDQAQLYANMGMPVVTAIRNLNGGSHGHVQVVRPSANGAYDPERGVVIAQAGRRLMNYAYITDVYDESLPQVVYYAHR